MLKRVEAGGISARGTVMGIYDRDYYRRDAGGTFGGFAAPGKICRWLILANVVAFIVQLSGLGGQFTNLFVLDVNAVLRGEVWRLVTYAFLHSVAAIEHIIMNLLVLWMFGRAVEDIYGPKEFLGLYLVAALAGGLAFMGF